jgi:3-oxoacyl-[acyl-carrier-protein] synthase-3
MSPPGPKIGFAGIGAYVPATVLTNAELEEVVDTTDEWIRTRTGIRTRRILQKDETILDLAVQAARRALADAGVEASEVGDIRVGVNTWMQFPSLATQLQEALGAKQASAADVAAGCAGFIYAVEEAYNKIFCEQVRYGRKLVSLVLGVEALSRITDWTDRNTCVLFGDGAGAVVLKEVERGEILATHTHADGRYGPMLYSDPVLEDQTGSNARRFNHKKLGTRPYLHMEGRKVYGVAVETMIADVQAVIDKYNRLSGASLGVGDIDYVYPHQANLRIIELVAKKLGLPLEKVYTEGIANYGNTSTASIPLGYWDNRERTGGAGGGGLEIDVAFGSGFASGAILRRA